jgi:hypothetical protein
LVRAWTYSILFLVLCLVYWSLPHQFINGRLMKNVERMQSESTEIQALVANLMDENGQLTGRQYLLVVDAAISLGISDEYGFSPVSTEGNTEFVNRWKKNAR